MSSSTGDTSKHKKQLKIWCPFGIFYCTSSKPVLTWKARDCFKELIKSSLMFVGFEVSKSQTRASHHFHWDYKSFTLGPNLKQSFRILQTLSEGEVHAILSHCRAWSFGVRDVLATVIANNQVTKISPWSHYSLLYFPQRHWQTSMWSNLLPCFTQFYFVYFVKTREQDTDVKWQCHLQKSVEEKHLRVTLSDFHFK